MQRLKTMVQFFILFIGIILLASCTKKTTVQEKINQSAKTSGFKYNIYESFDTIPNYQAVSASLFQQIIDHPKAIVIDVRTPSEIADGKIIDSALELDFYADDFQEQLQKLDKTTPYAVYCRSGNRSKKTLAKMKDLGFKEAYHLYGGILDWKNFSSTIK